MSSPPSTPSPIDGETLRRRYRHARDRLKYWRRQLRRTLRSPAATLAFHRHRKAVERGEWAAARDQLPEVVRHAEAAKDPQLLTQLAQAADRLGEYELASRLEGTVARLTGSEYPNEWRGGPLDSARLVIDFMETSKQGAATGLRYTGYAAAAAAKARETVLVTEPRLVPLYARTFPEFDVRAGPLKVKDKPGQTQYIANMRVLRNVIGSDPEATRRLFRPLKADPDEVERFRTAYNGDDGLPLVGISWWSSHHGKDLPSLGCWGGLMRRVPAVFVNVQYGDHRADIEQMQAASGRRIIDDASVDQLKDMDRFAAQLAALDAVVTISCTGAHLACALGVPTILVRDDWFRRDWPVLSSSSPWCPSALVAGKDGRSWETLFEQIAGQLEGVLSDKSTRKKYG